MNRSRFKGRGYMPVSESDEHATPRALFESLSDEQLTVGDVARDGGIKALDEYLAERGETYAEAAERLSAEVARVAQAIDEALTPAFKRLAEWLAEWRLEPRQRGRRRQTKRKGWRRYS